MGKAIIECSMLGLDPVIKLGHGIQHPRKNPYRSRATSKHPCDKTLGKASEETQC